MTREGFHAAYGECKTAAEMGKALQSLVTDLAGAVDEDAAPVTHGSIRMPVTVMRRAIELAGLRRSQAPAAVVWLKDFDARASNVATLHVTTESVAMLAKALSPAVKGVTNG